MILKQLRNSTNECYRKRMAWFSFNNFRFDISRLVKLINPFIK